MIALPRVPTYQFVKQEKWVYFLLDPFYTDLIASPLACDIPLINICALHVGKDGVRVGYQFEAPPKLTKIGPGYMMVSRDIDQNWQPHIGLPGLQIYLGDSGVILTSTEVNDYFRRIE